ncbi:MAG: gephyrin-like molybdotransferase Glp [Pseudomonadota bacterium]
MKGLSLGLHEALGLTLASVRPLPAESAPLMACVGRVAAADLRARVDSPPGPTSRKDGYALRRQDAAAATAEHPVRLLVIGCVAAGGAADVVLRPGTAVRVLTGARIPAGADVVAAEEFVRQDGDAVLIDTLAGTGKNILAQGGDVTQGDLALRAGNRISALDAGLLAAAGHDCAPVHAAPRVGILATGDEIVLPGQALAAGQLYASNAVTLAGLCRHYGMDTRLGLARDERPALREALAELAAGCDALLTSGGAWRGDRDLVAQVLGELGWEKVFHRIRIGPGKAVGFGLLAGKPVFLLPGGPPSNLMGFLQIALPGLLALAGCRDTGLPRLNARLAAGMDDGKLTWTDFFFGRLAPGEGLPVFQPLPKRSRLAAIARATAVVAIPEERERLDPGEVVSVQLLPGAASLSADS